VDDVVALLAHEHAALGDLVGSLDPVAFGRPTRCEGWDVADVVLHLAQTDEMALDSVEGRLGAASGSWRQAGPVHSVDEGASRLVADQRGEDPQAVVMRWGRAARRLEEVLGTMDLSTRVPWVAGELSARTLAATRLAETWIHGGDVAEALGVVRAPTRRLHPVARLAWRTLPYAFARAGRTLAGPVAFLLVGPDGERWDFVPDGEPTTTVTGPAVELCEVAARRRPAAATTLEASGPDAGAVLELVRTYA